MDPLQHMSLMREIGVDWYTPRVPLAMSPSSLDIIHITSSDALKPQPQVVDVSNITKALSGKVKPIINFGFDTPKNKSVDKNSVEVSPSKPIPLAKAVIVPFDLLVASGESIVFIVDVKSSPLTAVWERSVRQFFDEIDHACSSTDKKVQSLDYFSWPIAGSGNKSLGEDQLIQLLTGFMRQRIVGDKKGVILFGDNAKQYGTSVVSSMKGLQVIAAPALGVMFTSVTAKVALWRDLQALPIGNG